MKLTKKGKKEYKRNWVLSIVCLCVYVVCLFYVRFINYIETMFSNRYLFISVSMFSIIIIMFLNYIMCKGGWPNKKLYDAINNFDLATNNKTEIKKQRDTLLQIFTDTNYSIKIIICFEVVACIIVLVLFAKNVIYANLITGFIVDLQTAFMALLFYIDTHYKFKIQKNLK